VSGSNETQSVFGHLDCGEPMVTPTLEGRFCVFNEGADGTDLEVGIIYGGGQSLPDSKIWVKR